MACCGKNKNVAQPRHYIAPAGAQQFALVKRDGTTETFGSRLEADAQNARDGYTGIVKPKAV